MERIESNLNEVELETLDLIEKGYNLPQIAKYFHITVPGTRKRCMKVTKYKKYLHMENDPNKVTFDEFLAMNLTARIHNHLSRAAIHDYEDFLILDEDGLLAIRGIGPTNIPVLKELQNRIKNELRSGTN